MSNIGVVYVATIRRKNISNKVAQETYRSIRFLKHFNPDIPVALIGSTHILKMKRLRSIANAVIPSKYPKLDGTMGAKIQALELSPYNRTLILDNDTIPIKDIRKGFSYINNHGRHIALSIAPRQELRDESGITNFQNGVMFVKKCPETLNLFKEWQEKVLSSSPSGPTRFIFSKLLYEHPEITIYPLSYYWNFRIDLLVDLELVPLIKVLPRIRIFHSHLERKKAIAIFKSHPDYEELSKIVNGLC
jgi:hypothetical protein